MTLSVLGVCQGPRLPLISSMTAVDRGALFSMSTKERALSSLSMTVYSKKEVAFSLLSEIIKLYGEQDDETKIRSIVNLVNYAVESPLGHQILSAERAAEFKKDIVGVCEALIDVRTRTYREVFEDEFGGKPVGPFLLSMAELLFFHANSQAELVGSDQHIVHLTPAAFKGTLDFINTRDYSDVNFLRELYSRLLSKYLPAEEAAELDEGEEHSLRMTRRLRLEELPSSEEIADRPIQDLLGYLFIMCNHQRCHLVAKCIGKQVIAITEEHDPREDLLRRGIYFTQLNSG